VRDSKVLEIRSAGKCRNMNKREGGGVKILGIDTTTKFLTIGIYDGAGICEYSLEVDRRLSVLLAKTIKMILDALDWQPHDLDYLACGLGPGSFTGIRIGLAAIKGLGWAINKPVVGISTLDILAKNSPYTDNTIVPLIDAKRNLVYCGFFKKKNGRLNRLRPYMLLSIEEFLKSAEPGSIILGDAANLYKEKILREIKKVTILDKDYWYPKAHNIILLALDRIRGGRIGNAFDIKPIYLYPKECQIK
jgi:tRNA threonylcarbamoyladenosine biosynthesis protein TsaB